MSRHQARGNFSSVASWKSERVARYATWTPGGAPPSRPMEAPASDLFEHYGAVLTLSRFSAPAEGKDASRPAATT
jgi:hypothetical protein